MLGLVLRRLLMLVPTLLVVSFGLFSLIALIPGDAATTLAGGIDAPPEAVQEIRESLNLDRPFLEQYGAWVKGAVRLDFGESLASEESIRDQLAERVPITLGLIGVVLGLILVLALLGGVGGGLRPGSLVDRALLLGSSLTISMPSFWVALVLVTIFAVQLQWLPPFGFVHFSDSPLDWLRGLILPAIALSLAPAAITSRQLRAGLANTMQSAYIRTAWAKGGTTSQVIVRHALKNASLPAVTVLGLQVSGLLGATVVIERIFSIPGLGTYLVGAVFVRDIPVVLGCAVVFVVVNVAANLAVDIVYGYLNPKVRVS